jgi:hypothetical protein
MALISSSSDSVTKLMAPITAWVAVTTLKLRVQGLRVQGLGFRV